MSEETRTTLGPADLSDGELRGYAVGKRNLLVTCSGGQLRAMDDSCNHGGCLLSAGWLEQGTVVCPCHEIGFDLITGKNMTSPGIADDQVVYPLELVDGNVVVVGFPKE
jgi:3-phenylpropionate/trans-cinnamate dioxygenase ferredoxin subunit